MSGHLVTALHLTRIPYFRFSMIVTDSPREGFPRFIADDGLMSSLSWLASPILIIVTSVVAALRLRRRAHVPLPRDLPSR